MVIDLDVRPATEAPATAGWFLCWLRSSERPVVLWRSALSGTWRAGCQVQQVDAWAGPIPGIRGKA